MPQASAGRHIRNEGYVSADDGAPLYYREWLPANADVTSVVLFVHGIGLHGDAPPYGTKIINDSLLGRGTAFFAADIRGHGKSGGSVEEISGDVLAGDLKRQIEHLREKHGSVPVYLYGHNFGGILSLAYAAAHGRDVRGVIVSEYSRLIKSSARQIVEPGAGSSLMSRMIGRLHHRSRSFRFMAPEEYRQLCCEYHIPVDSRILTSLELSGSPGCQKMYGKEFFSACGAGDELRIAKNVRSPVLMIFARNDPFFDVRGAYDVLTRVNSFDKMLVQVEIAGHYGIIESGQDHIDRWITQRNPRNG
ncbi:MAG: Alpha/beta hydrolase family protein [Methanocella sp. PtaU1.Bin125]|nr:MAG: Alpha/beta hydrolase family protein [Methanocella sp. PtaU1.Bin125]